MKKVIVFACASLTMLFMACGSSKSVQETRVLLNKTVPISVQTIPNGAKVYVNGKFSTTTPSTINVPVAAFSNKSMERSAKEKSLDIQIAKDGYKTIKDIIIPEIYQDPNPYIYNLSWPESRVYELEETPNAYQKDPTIPVGAANERVTRDTSGNTALERTIIRWYFDSAPQGARIYWRVISSVPAEVKNTNELWLGSTPFEETRAFNIQGLTYENSRDVQIEIKVKRKGYVDQNKRFNVRQAIDQQEISSFFDMVEE